MSEIYDKIVHEYQQEILNFCYSRLNNYQAAEDCTQEVFFVLFRKIKLLNLSVNIRSWLYSTAIREIKAYKRKNPTMIDINEIPEQPCDEINLSDMNVLDELNEDEKNFISDYYSGINIAEIAKKYGISISAVYVRVFRIKKKIHIRFENYYKINN